MSSHQVDKGGKEICGFLGPTDIHWVLKFLNFHLYPLRKYFSKIKEKILGGTPLLAYLSEWGAYFFLLYV